MIGFNFLHKCGNSLIDLMYFKLVGITQNRHHQPLVTADGDTDVIKMMIDDIITVDTGIDQRKLLERLDTCLDKKRHEAEGDPVPLQVMLSMAAAQCLDP